MTKVIFKGNVLTVKNHSGYKKTGEDIVCSSISSVVFFLKEYFMINGINYEYEENQDIPMIRISVPDEKILKASKSFFKKLAIDYKKYVEVVEENKWTN